MGDTRTVSHSDTGATPLWAQRVIAAHLAVTDAVSHGGRLQSDRYLVWQEDGANDFEAGGVHAEKGVTGSTDLFTKQEFDPWRDELEAAFDAAGLVWTLNSCQFEEETGFWHYEWDWEVFA